RRRADVNPCVAAGQAGRPNAGMCQGVVGDFEKMTMLRVELLGFARTHPEGESVKPPHIVDHAGSERVASSDLVRRWMVVRLCCEPVRGDPAHTGTIVPQEGPECVYVCCTRNACCIPNDRDFVPACH